MPNVVKFLSAGVARRDNTSKIKNCPPSPRPPMQGLVPILHRRLSLNIPFPKASCGPVTDGATMHRYIFPAGPGKMGTMFLVYLIYQIFGHPPFAPPIRTRLIRKNFMDPYDPSIDLFHCGTNSSMELNRKRR